ncbi:MAG: ABC transporter permease [bacterium]|nr:transporter [Deltaproteobacteria bacterium]MCP4903617.1 ABC transporter permease [bacterium]
MSGVAEDGGFIGVTGRWFLGVLEELGRFGRLVGQSLRVLGRRGFPVRETIRQFESVVVRSSTIVLITALFTGMVLALQTATALGRFGAKPYTGSFVGLAFVLELGPVLTALVVSGRVGAGITAEIGAMTVSEQVDAIRALGADPVQKLVVPRMLAATIGLPMLTMLANVLGIVGGLLIASQLGIGANFYYQSVVGVVTLADLVSGLIKTLAFGWTISMVACDQGLSTMGGTVGVGRATTRAVVISSIAVLVSDFFLTKLILMLQ